MSLPATALTIAIPTYRRTDSLLQLLDTLQKWPVQPAAILVIDQTEHMEATQREAIESWADTPHHQYLPRSTPNLPAARNIAVEHTDTPWITFLDDDALPTETYLDAALASLANPQIDAVAGRVIGGYSPPPVDPFDARDPRHDVWQIGFDGDQALTGIASLPGGNHIVRTEAIRAIGGYDERFTGWAFREDADAALRLWEADYRIDYTPGLAIQHPGSSEGGCRTPPPESRDAFAERAWPEVWFWHKHFSTDPSHLRRLLKEGRHRYIFNRENLTHPQRLRSAQRGFDDAVRRARELSRTTED